MFNGANQVVVNGGLFQVANAAGSPKGLDRLIAEVATNAITNAGGRADEVRCFPGTREEVLGKLEEFMDDNNPGKKRMVWLSGPAGAGKSAISQTVAERCSERGQQAANFFFFRGDSTRSHSKPLVATLVYQLRRLYPAFDEPLSDYLATDPLICGASIEQQFKQLISYPIQTIQQSTPIQQQIIIIIDGLDECNDERDQDQILVALHKLAHADNSPFLVLVSSRAEPFLVMSFNRLGGSVTSIFLNDEYKPQKDIRLFVVTKLAEIKKDHYLAQTLPEDWPADADIDMITNKSSGQFVYAATVVRVIQFSSESPALSLIAILKTPSTTNHNPFAQLDVVYSHIFSKVNTHTVKLILFARSCTKYREGYMGSRPLELFQDLLHLVGYKDIEVQSYFADLAAIVKVIPGSKTGLVLEFYHASLEDYLDDKSRSTIYYVNENEIAAELSSMCLRNIHYDDPYLFQLTLQPLRWVNKPTPELSKSLLDLSTKCLGSGKMHALFLKPLMRHLERLYWKHDKAQFKALLQSWSRFVYINNIDEIYSGAVTPGKPSAFQYYNRHWMYNEQKPLVPPDSIPAGGASSNAQIAPTRASPNAAIGAPVGGLNFCKPGAPPGILLTAPFRDHNPGGSTESHDNDAPPVPPKNTASGPSDVAGTTWTHSRPNDISGRSDSRRTLNIQYSRISLDGGGDSLENERQLDSLKVQTGTVEQQETATGPARSYTFFRQLFGSLKRKVTHHQPRSTVHAIKTYDEEAEGNGSREYSGGPYKLRMIRVKIHYQDDVRGMTLTPDTPFSEFVNNVALKFGKNLNELVMKFKDEDGGMITLCDDSDYKFAIETARERSQGKAEGKLEIWCQDGA